MFCFLLVIILATVHIYFFHLYAMHLHKLKIYQISMIFNVCNHRSLSNKKKNRCEQLKTVFFSQRVKSVFVFIYVDTNTEFTSCANITKRLDLVAMILFLLFFLSFSSIFSSSCVLILLLFSPVLLIIFWMYMNECVCSFLFLFISFDMVRWESPFIVSWRSC